MGFRNRLSVAALMGAALLTGTGVSAKDRLVVTQWGGVWGESLENFVIGPFEKKYDVQVDVLRAASAGELLPKIRAEKDRPTIDVYFAGIQGARALAKEGLAVELDEKDVPAIKGLSPTLIRPIGGKVYFAGINTRANGLMVRKDLVKLPEKVTMQWVADPSLKGMVSIPNMAFGHGLIVLAGALAGGGASNQDIEPGFTFLKKIAPNVKALYQSSGEAGRLITTGEAAVAYVSSGAVAAPKKAGIDVDFYAPADMPLMLDADAVMVVKNGPAGRDLALKFVNFFLEPDRINPYSFGVGSSSPLKDGPPPPKDKVPVPITNEQMGTAFFADDATSAWIDANFDTWNERFTREIQPALGR